ncbi:MAG: hypothetical protein KC478_05060, partial [Bacteriovoracaceae bacterium]|nr:hypothetical protein [Bacteriovoracaceae bacterium]
IFIKTASRTPASAKRESAMDYYRSVVPAPKKKVKRKPKAKVNYYGFDFDKQAPVTVTKAKVKKVPAKKIVKVVTIQAPTVEKKKTANRVPASIAPAAIVDDINSAFEKSLDQKVQNNKRHSSEVNQLIDELKSFKKDYSKHY